MRKLNSEEVYINKRKWKALLVSLAYYLLRIIPIKKNKIVFTAFEGIGGFCCNPRYIAEELIRRNQQLELVWLVNDVEKHIPLEIIKVKNTFWNRVYHLSTSRIWIDNSRKEYGTRKRKGQTYIQTWHAGLGFKPIGKFRGKLFPKIAYLISEYDSILIDYVTSNSNWCTKLYPEMLLYDGPIIKTGSPRCDILVTKRDKIYQDIRKQYNLPEDSKIVMYAPTFRGGSQKGSRQVFVDNPTLDFPKMIAALNQKFGGEWFVFLRLHPQLAAQIDKLPLSNDINNKIDVSQADDMNELLAACDAFVTDYSSTAFDAINIYMPVFLYADDLEQYTQERGQLMWDMNTLPFTVALTNDELVKNIHCFNMEDYIKNITEFLDEHEVLEDGYASIRIVDTILS